MFDKFLEGNHTFNGELYVKVKFNILYYIYFRLTHSMVSESFYHILCKGNQKNRSGKMSLFSIFGEKRQNLEYYRNNDKLYIMLGLEGISVKITK